MEAADGCEITRLPEELLSAALALTTPRDACRAAAVSRDFHEAADSDAVWDCFLPTGVPPPAANDPFGSCPAPPSNSKKGRFLRLSDRRRPVLVADGRMSLWLDRETGAKCYMISPRALHISWGDTPQYWRWIHLLDSRFEAAELVYVWWFEVRGKIHSKMLSQDSAYAAYIVFKTTNLSSGLAYPPLEASIISVTGMKSTRKVCLQSYESDLGQRRLQQLALRTYLVPVPAPVLPRQRSDGWMELEMGVFYNKAGDDGEVGIDLMQTEGTVKTGLIVLGIEIRPKKQA